MNESNLKAKLEVNIFKHIFSVSAGMVGVCMTVIGLIRVVITLQKVNTLADDLLAIDAILFLVTCLTSYWVLRTHRIDRMHRLERFTDFVFISAMILMVANCLFITYAVSF